ncbi:MAG: PAS domain-containing protein [Holophaga sp.]|nr:PAS domain-containing protein [Holophaga sp.]
MKKPIRPVAPDRPHAPARHPSMGDFWRRMLSGQHRSSSQVTQLLQLVLDNIPQAVFWKDRDSAYVWCNRNFAIDVGVGPPEHIVGKTDYDLPFTREQADSYRQIDQRVMGLDLPEYQFNETQAQADGKLARVITNKIPLHDREGRVVGILGTYEDVTEQRLAEEALQRAHDELETRVKERTAAEREQRTLAEALRDTAALLTSTLDLDEVLDRILVAIARVVPHETANIVLAEGTQARVVRFRDQNGQFEPARNLGCRIRINDFPRLKQMTHSHQPVIVNHRAGAIDWVADPDRRWVRSCLGAPIEMDSMVLGFINLNSATPRFFTPLHVQRLRAFADQAAIAINNAHLYEQAQELATLKERQRLARDLHDAVSQTLWTTSLIADVLPAVWAEDPGEGMSNLEQLGRLTRGALAEMRSLLVELRPAALLEATLGSLMQQLAQAVMSRKKLDIAVTVEGERPLAPDLQIGIYRLAQESLNNIAKHSKATQASIALQWMPDRVRLVIEDNGRGFDPAEVAPNRLGLGIMRERAEALGARLDIHSEPGRGARITVVCPCGGKEGTHA